MSPVTPSHSVVLRAQPLTADAFAPYGSLIETHSGGGRSVNQGRARRMPGISDLWHDAAAHKPTLDTYHITPSPLPFVVACFERHPLTAQVFIPLHGARLLVVVAPDHGADAPDIANARAFICGSDTIIHYRAGAWHSPLVALDAPAHLAMLMWETGDARDCEELAVSSRLEITA